MLARLLKLLIIVAWIPFGFALGAIGLFLFIPTSLLSVVKWILTGRDFNDWLIDVYCEFFFYKVHFGAIDKIIDYKK